MSCLIFNRANNSWACSYTWFQNIEITYFIIIYLSNIDKTVIDRQKMIKTQNLLNSKKFLHVKRHLGMFKLLIYK